MAFSENEAELRSNRAKMVRDRRLFLNMSVAEAAERAKVSILKWESIESDDAGWVPQDRVLCDVSRALSWQPDVLAKVCVRADPDSFPTVKGVPEREIEIDEIRTLVGGLTNEGRQTVLDLARRLPQTTDGWAVPIPVHKPVTPGVTR